MAILEGDIKLLKSAVMADTDDGGGQMSGEEVVDGESNNLFPDTSEIDRALGRVNLRKVFGVAHSLDTDTLLGAHAIITDGPDDPLVHCTLMKSTSWADERSDAQEVIERYLVKGPRFTCRLMDTHYAGSMTIRLYQQVGASDFPVAGDAVVLRNPNGQEQYVRLTKLSNTVQQTYNVSEGSGTVAVTVVVNTYDLGTALQYDFLGAPVARSIANEQTAYASLYNTVAATGAAFYGIKTLDVAADTGDLTLRVADGIFSPLVPAATIETPLIDQVAYAGAGGLATTGQASVTLPAVTSNIGPDTTIYAPTAIQPNSISLVHGAVTFTDNAGVLYQGTTAVGAVDYRGGRIVFSPSSPSYGSASNTLTYTPASAINASSFSAELMVTSVNQGLSFTDVFEPPPKPGTFALSYMAQGRWYVLRDNALGKLEGSDAAYGVGTINYTTGSMAVTLGALPDVGSPLIADWGDDNSAKAVTTSLPAKLYAELELPDGTAANGITVSWSNGATNYTATTNASGVLSGGATGQLEGNILKFYPNVFPTGAITVDSDNSGTTSSSYTGSGLTPVLTNAPVVPGSFRGSALLAGIPANVLNLPNTVALWDSNGVLYGRAYYAYGSTLIAFGSINYSTGQITGNSSINATAMAFSDQTGGGIGFAEVLYRTHSATSVPLTVTAIVPSTYAYGTAGPQENTFSPTDWYTGFLQTSDANAITTDALIKIGGDLYSAVSGALRKGWNLSTGQATVPSAGTLTNEGLFTVSSLPSNSVNALTWYNVAQDLSGNKVTHGVYRTSSAPLKSGVFQILLGALDGSGDGSGDITGDITGTVDYERGVVRWTTASPERAGDIRYNAVFLQYLPLDSELLGLETARLPLDGKVPIFRSGGIVVVHNTQTYTLPNPLTQGTVYNLGRERIAAVKVKTATGATVDTTKYETALDAGTIVFPVEADLTGLVQPFTVDHRIEDVMLCSIADISGDLTFTRSLTHDFPADTSYVSSALVAGDVFARSFNFIEQSTWTGVWSDELIGSAPTANYNETLNPIAVTNQGAITERWAMIFTNTTTFRIVGETVGEIGAGNTGVNCAPVNPATGQPYFTIPSAGWGTGWAAGNVYRFNTEACGEPFWVVRTILQGPATLQDDTFTLAFRGDVDRP